MEVQKDTKSLDALRPTRSSDFVGNRDVIRRITKMFAENLIPTLMLFSGPTGVGKTTLCRMITRALYCEERKEGEFEACGTCKMCRRPLNDYNYIHKYQEVGAADIDDKYFWELDFDALNPRNVFFIDELQDLKSKYYGSLRKIVESAQAKFLFATTHPEDIEDALRNRIKPFEYELKRPEVDEVVKHLATLYPKHGISVENESLLRRIAIQHQSEMRTCVSFLRRIQAETGGKLTTDYLDSLWGSNIPGTPNPNAPPLLLRPKI